MYIRRYLFIRNKNKNYINFKDSFKTINKLKEK